MFCPSCGKRNSDDSKFCEFCGAELISNADVQKTSLNTVNENTDINTVPYDDNAYNYQVMTSPAKSSNKSIIIIAEIVAIVALAAVLFSGLKKEYGPERVAEQYFQTYAEGDLKSVYKYIDAGEGKFMNEDTFESMIALSDETPRGEVSNYSVRVKSKDDYRANVIITYQTKSKANTDQKMNLTLTKTGKKKLFIFDEWAVSNNFEICKDFSIYLPKSSEVTIDGIDVVKNASQEKLDNDQVRYSIDKIYSGNHLVEVKTEGFQNIKEIVYFEDGSEYSPSLKLKKDTVKKITDDAVKNMKKYIDAAIHGNSIDSVIKVKKENLLHDDFESFCSNIQCYDYETDQTYLPCDVNVSNVETQFKQLSIYDEYDDDDDDDSYIPSVGSIEIKADMEEQYPASYIDNGNISFTQTYYYGFKDGKVSLVEVRTDY